MQQGELDQTASLGSCSQVVCVEKSQLNKKLAFELGPVNPANLQQLRMININTLPVRYSDKFYRDLLEKYNSDYLRFAFWNGFAVAAVCARLEDYDDSHPEWRKLYIMTINVLAAYRRRGVGSELLRYVLDKAEKDESIKEVYLHVQISNSDAREFYLRHGFEEVGVIKDYYRNIDPPDCYLFRKVL